MSSTLPLLGSFHESHRRLLARSDHTAAPVYLGLVFKAYFLRTTGQFALAYFFLIVLGIAERLFSLAIDSIRDRPGQPWRIFPRACLYFVVTMIRYVLMIAIMNVYIPMFLVICLGLALGQIAVEVIRYFMMVRRIKRNGGENSSNFSPLKEPALLAETREITRTNHVSESCC
ncbi:hypothetical protein GGI25_002451 [Coemansia spiralis]|uniref:Copper transport protein n=2 Tax=Coemansia TaxID=4863 RepID=A0A9W8G3P3_9FUNG|nr:hypothetical protein BX070DRAFT_132582 [Coemansia spiralis]KAJ1995434.1 hypothetical protein EDC05_000986 [Coemansia umbellata]KAJ2624736.1 hypothetical protein GGI26_001152 [Coemansia sp. RSA 1358]KAJ2678279.1 hypothetical protein GGI25_002451 [Coemansia spiralis]